MNSTCHLPIVILVAKPQKTFRTIIHATQFLSLSHSRSKESLFKDEMLFSRTGDADSSSDKMVPKSCLMNLSTTLSDSFDNSEDENKELVNKCNTTDKTQYTIAFDSNESRYGHNMVASSNFDYLTSSIYNCAKNRIKIGENGNNESPQSIDTVTNATESDDTLSYHTLSNNSPQTTLNTYSNSNFHERNTFLPIYDLKASSTSISPDSNQVHAAGSRFNSSHRNTEYTQETKCEHQEEKQNRLNSRSMKTSQETRESTSLTNLNCHSHRNQTASVNQGPSHLRTSSNIISPCSLLPPGNAHEILQQQQQQQQQVLTLSPHLQHLYENRLKHASPIREEDEPSTDSSRADVEMVSDSEKGTPSSTSDSSPLAPPGKSSVFNGTTATNSRSGPWSSSQLDSEFSSDALTNRSEINRNCNLRMSSGFTSNTSRPASMAPNNSGESPRQNMAEWLKKTSIMASPRGFFRQAGGSEPPTPSAGHQMCSGGGHSAVTDHRYHQYHYHGYNHHHMAAMRSPSSANYSCVSHHQPHYFAEGRCCCTGHPSVGGQATAAAAAAASSSSCSSHRQRRQYTDNVNSEQVSPSKDTIYVCYPNYSLPDLSFLNSPNANTPVGDVCLSPTKPLVRPPTVDRCSGSSIAASNASTLKSASKTRPKSLNDVATLTKSALAKVKDWDSINFLLSPEVKAILGAKGLVPRSGATSFFPENKNPTKNANPSSDAVTPVHQVKLRARSTALPGNKIKRYSLQEPVQSTVKSSALNCAANRRGLVRSETLPTQDAGYATNVSVSGHCRLSHATCVIPGSNNYCCHPPPLPPQPASCCHHRGFSLCCDSSHHRQSLINREDYIETLKELLTLQDAEREVGQILGALSPSVEKKVCPGRTSLVNEDVSGARVDLDTNKSRGSRPSKMILKSPGECKPIVPPKPSSLGASPSKFKSFIPVPKTPARNCSPPVASKCNTVNPKLPSQPLVRCTKPTKAQKKSSK